MDWRFPALADDGIKCFVWQRLVSLFLGSPHHQVGHNAGVPPAPATGTSSLARRRGSWFYTPVQGSGGKTVPEPEKPWSLSYRTMKVQNSDADENGQIKPGAPAEQFDKLDDDLGQPTTNCSSTLKSRRRGTPPTNARPSSSSAAAGWAAHQPSSTKR